jgi:2-polyprenyl-3-methyl-5-hydroxy-6-metoxy-1,4-benzoquinol methylase
MARQGEYHYYKNIGEAAVLHSLNKPFSDESRSARLMKVGAVLSLLPRPPARILECGCGVGWFASILAKSGYDVVAQDVSSDAIQLAREHPLFTKSPAPQFIASDFQDLDYANEFDAVIFFDSLHHAIDETQAIRAAWRAPTPNGRLIASEPGVGHAKAYGQRYAAHAYHAIRKEDRLPVGSRLSACSLFRRCAIWRTRNDRAALRAVASHFSPPERHYCTHKVVSISQRLFEHGVS